MSKRYMQQTTQVDTSEQAASTIAAAAVAAYPALSGGSLEDYEGKEGFEETWPSPGKAFKQVSDVRTTEQDGAVDSAPQTSYPGLGASLT